MACNQVDLRVGMYEEHLLKPLRTTLAQSVTRPRATILSGQVASRVGLLTEFVVGDGLIKETHASSSLSASRIGCSGPERSFSSSTTSFGFMRANSSEKCSHVE